MVSAANVAWSSTTGRSSGDSGAANAETSRRGSRSLTRLGIAHIEQARHIHEGDGDFQPNAPCANTIESRPREERHG